jgi:hypothetical protein
MGVSTRNDRSKVDVILKWELSATADLGAHIAKALENILTNKDVNWPKEIRTLKFEGLLTV